MSKPTNFEEDDILPAILGLLLWGARPFVVAAALQTACAWHFGNYPMYPFWTFFAGVMCVNVCRGATRPRGDYWPNVDFLLHQLGSYVGLGLALGVAWLCAP